MQRRDFALLVSAAIGVWQRVVTKWAIWATRVQFSVTGGEFVIARRRRWFITWRFASIDNVASPLLITPSIHLSVVVGIICRKSLLAIWRKAWDAGAGGVVGRDSGYCVITLPAA
jgi:hypothetical protein